MVEVTKKKYPLNPTLRWTTQDGRLTTEGFRIMRAVSDVLETVSIEDGEVTTDMIAAGAITAGKITVTSLDEISTFLGDVAIDGDLIVGGTITTSKLEDNAVTATATNTVSGGTFPHLTTFQEVIALTVPVVAGRPVILAGLIDYTHYNGAGSTLYMGLTVQLGLTNAFTSTDDYVLDKPDLAHQQTDSPGTTPELWRPTGMGQNSNTRYRRRFSNIFLPETTGNMVFRVISGSPNGAVGRTHTGITRTLSALYAKK